MRNASVSLTLFRRGPKWPEYRHIFCQLEGTAIALRAKVIPSSTSPSLAARTARHQRYFPSAARLSRHNATCRMRPYRSIISATRSTDLPFAAVRRGVVYLGLCVCWAAFRRRHTAAPSAATIDAHARTGNAGTNRRVTIIAGSCTGMLSTILRYALTGAHHYAELARSSSEAVRNRVWRLRFDDELDHPRTGGLLPSAAGARTFRGAHR